MKTSSSIYLTGICGLILLGAFGCGGGGGSASSTPSKSALAHSRIAASARISRSVLAITGFGKTISSAAGTSKSAAAGRFGGFGFRVPSLLQAITTRALGTPAPVVPTLDPGTGLYYTTQLNPDGSGKQLLFVDMAMTQPAGSFVWLMPVWTSTRPPTYPATIVVNYSITAGSFAGVSGNMRVTVNDANFGNGVIELALTDALHESAKANFDVSQEGITGSQTVDLGNGDTCSVSDSTDSSGAWVDVFTYPDGIIIDMSTQTDGTSTETYSDPSSTTDGGVDATSTVQADGTDTINYSTGEVQTVNVDPGSSDSSSSDSSSSDGSDSSKGVKRVARPVTGGLRGK